MKVAELLLKYKTDKNYGTINPKLGHCYGESYDDIFEMFDKNKEINFLEIGIQKGGSLLAWKDYFANANIYGVDIVDVILDEYRRDDINYIISDIKNESVKDQLKDIMFDIIIDDGSHVLSDVLYVISNYLSKLNKGGVLIVEDCQEPNNWINQINWILETMGDQYTLTTSDLRSINGHYDDFLIIIKKN